MGVAYDQAVRMSAGELGCTYAAMILYDDDQEISEDKLKTLLNAAGVTFESYWPSLYAKMLGSNDVGALLTKPAGGSGGGVAVAAAAGGDAGAAPAAEEEEERRRRRQLSAVAFSVMMATTIR